MARIYACIRKTREKAKTKSTRLGYIRPRAKPARPGSQRPDREPAERCSQAPSNAPRVTFATPPDVRDPQPESPQNRASDSRAPEPSRRKTRQDNGTAPRGVRIAARGPGACPAVCASRSRVGKRGLGDRVCGAVGSCAVQCARGSGVDGADCARLGGQGRGEAVVSGDAARANLKRTWAYIQHERMPGGLRW